MMDARELLQRLLMECFGRITLDPAKGTGIPDKYFYGRINNENTPPINQYCADQLNRLFRFALSERSSFNPGEVADKLAAVLSDVSEMSLWSVPPNEKRATDGKATLLDLLAALLQVSVGKNEIPTIRVRVLFTKLIAGESPDESAEETVAMFRNGVASFSTSIAEADFSELIEGVTSQVDVCHFGGFSWTSLNRGALGDLLKKPGVTVRVALLAEDSEFFKFYSAFTGASTTDLLNEVKEEVSLWKTIFAEAAAQSESHGTLFIYRHSGFPSKNLYRFDRRMVMSPLPSIRFDFSPPAVSFEQSASSEMDYFAAYEREMEWFFGEGGELGWMSSAIYLLSPVDKELVFALLDCGELGIAELSSMFGMHATKVFSALGRLESLGLVERTPSSKRALTEQGVLEVKSLIEGTTV